MKKKKISFLIALALVVPLLSFAFTAVSSEPLAFGKLVEPPISLQKLRELLPGVEISVEVKEIKDSGIIEIYGSNIIKIYHFGRPPELRSEKEHQEWFDNLVNLAIRLENEYIPSLLDGPVGGLGVAYTGYYSVTFHYTESFTEETMVEIFRAINKVAREIGFEKGVPISFGRCGPLELVNRALPYRPIIGGVQIQIVDLGYLKTPTLGWSAVRDGVNGYVVSGHLGYNRPTPSGATIYQPTYPNYPAGTIRAVPAPPYYADVAWVEFTNVAPKIYLTAGLIVSVNFYQEPSVNSTVYMSGRTSELVDGVVRYVNRTTYGHPYFIPLYRQAYATFPQKGAPRDNDSGAPVYIPTQYGRGIVGIIVGYEIVNAENLGVFSQTSGVRDEVGAIPITTWP